MKTVRKYKEIIAIILLLTFIPSTLIPVNAIAQEKNGKTNVVWVHGFMGEGWADTHIKNYSNRQMNSHYTNYRGTKESGVEGYSNVVLDRVLKNLEKPPIIIGHSMGGMVARHLDIGTDRNLMQGHKPKGIIALGSPLKGSNLTNTYKITTFFSTFYYRSLQATIGLDILVGEILTNVLGIVLSGASDIIAKPFIPTIDDLAENSFYNREISKYSTTTPKIHIWGNEEQPVIWNLLSKTKSFKDIKSYVNDMGNRAKTLKKKVFIFYLSYQQAEDFFIGGEADIQWSRDVLNNYKIEETPFRKWVSGSVHSSKVSNNCRNLDWFGWLCKVASYPGSVIIYDFDAAWDLVTNNYQVTVALPSDGIVTYNSQKGEGQEYSKEAKEIEARGVNHFEMDEHQEIDKIFNKIWNGDGDGKGKSSVFYIPKK